MDVYSIYELWCARSNKSYIGYTSLTPDERFELHCKDAQRTTNSHIHHAIAKYGREAFEVRTIYQSKDSQHTLEEMEPFFISEYRKLGEVYNIQEGGRGYRNNPRSKPVELYDADFNLVETCKSTGEVARKLCCHPSTVMQACRQADLGRGSQLKGFWACYAGSKPVKKDTSYMTQRNQTIKPFLGKKRPDHAAWMRINNPRKKTGLFADKISENKDVDPSRD